MSSAPHLIDNEYDLVFAGGGTAACITASRLAADFPDLRILVLECGPTTEDKLAHIQPGQYLTHLAPHSKTMQFFESLPSQHVAGRRVVVPSARCIGGGSSTNFMLYNRPSASDFDDWEVEFGNAGWAARDMIPLLEKAETYEIDPAKSTHGSDGPLKVSFGGEALDIGMEFIKLGPKFEKDRPFGDEGNGLNVASINTFFQMPKWISSNGRRSDVPHNYAVYNSTSKNLYVLDGCLVNRVIVSDGIATGVEYIFDKRVYENAPQDIRTVKARKLVVVSAGAMGSPQILERSGIGRKEVLKKAGIPLIAELDGVGENYQDHAFLVTLYLADADATTFDSVFRGEPETWSRLLAQWEKDGTGLMPANGVDGAIKMRPRAEELAELGPEFQEHWDRFFASKPDKPLFWLSALGGGILQSSCRPVGAPASQLYVFGGYPASRGYIHVSSSDPYAPPDFNAGFLSNYADVVALRWGYKKGRELIRRMSMFRGALVPAHPLFTAGSDPAESLGESKPVSLDAPKIVYSAEDDKAIDDNARQFVGTTWHSLGTCAMKPLDQGGVVDNKLNVHGVKRLKVADLSIPPSNVNAITYSTAVAIGEKAALIIAGELGAQ
ncbi:alcohol oxidase-like protein [Mucidula mucida]|nr:alcohol oxidase-like protein [Mucidula mucida]